MKLLNIVTLTFILLSYFGIAQNASNAEVLFVVPIGSQSYSIIEEAESNYYYKTSPHENNELTQGQHVQLTTNQEGNSDFVQVNASTLTKNLFCQRLSSNESSKIKNEIDYRRFVSFNSEFNVLVFDTWENVKALEALLEEESINYPFNRGNDAIISQTLRSIKANGWTISDNATRNTVNLNEFKKILIQSHPLSTDVLINILELNEVNRLDPDFMRDVFISNVPFSSTLEERLTESTIDPLIKSKIIEANDSHLVYPNYVFQDFLTTFTGYCSLYEKLNNEEQTKLHSGMDPSDPEFDNSIVALPFERLITNCEHEVWVEGILYKIYSDCRAIAIKNNVSAAFQSLSILNDQGGPTIPALEESITGIPNEDIASYIPMDYIVYNPQEFDPLGSISDDLNYNTALQVYNLVEGCPKSNFTYSLYVGNDFTVKFYDQTNFNNQLYPEENFIQYWNFDDGTGSFQKNPTHAFPDYGTYNVSLTTFIADCGCWHVHKAKIIILEPQLKQGNPACPFENVKSLVNWNNDPLSVQVTAEPNITAAVPPNTSVLNYNFAFFTAAGTPVHQEDRGVLNFIFHDLEFEGEYYVVVTATWDGGCISTSDQHAFTIVNTPKPAQCCDKKNKVTERNHETTYNNNKYRLKTKDIARGTFGTASWRKIQGTQKLYSKKPSKLFWKEHTAWHKLTIEGTYYNRVGDVCREGIFFGPQLVQNCGSKYSSLSTYSPSFPNQFGIDEEGIVIKHIVYLDGVMMPDNSTVHCCDCYNVWGHKLFDFTVKLGKCD